MSDKPNTFLHYQGTCDLWVDAERIGTAEYTISSSCKRHDESFNGELVLKMPGEFWLHGGLNQKRVVMVNSDGKYLLGQFHRMSRQDRIVEKTSLRYNPMTGRMQEVQESVTEYVTWTIPFTKARPVDAAPLPPKEAEEPTLADRLAWRSTDGKRRLAPA